MKKIMILGAGPLQVPAILEIKKMGFYLYACDYDPNAVGFEYCDEHFLISTLDKQSILKKVEEVKPDYLITSTSDAPVQVVASVCEKTGLFTGISFKDSICATEKWAMRNRLLENGVPIPKFFVCKNLAEADAAASSLGYKCVIKPSDSSASRGVYFLSSKEQLNDIYKYVSSFSRNDLIMIEELMVGPEVSVECIICDGEVSVVTITDKMVTPLPYFVELGHSEPSQLPSATQDAIKKVAIAAVKAINIRNGVSHVEIKVTNEGPKIVELAARLGGDYITSKLVPLSTGYDMVKNSVLLNLGMKPDPIIDNKKGSAIMFLHGNKGVIKSIDINGRVYSNKKLVELKLYKKVGEKVESLKSSNDRIGHIITFGDDARDAVAECERIMKDISITIE